VSDFPPQDLRSFLEFCAGDWLAVRSSFQLEAGGRSASETPPPPASAAAEGPFQAPASGAEAAKSKPDQTWHAAHRGELVVAYLPPERDGEPGGLVLTPPSGEGGDESRQRLRFQTAGDFHHLGAQGEPLAKGTWQLWPDGSLELTQLGEQGVVREWIWFTKPNLRLRSSVEQRLDGQPGRASFSSEIRRVSRSTPPGVDTPTGPGGSHGAGGN
jgi:hypothetical protein